MKLKWKVSEKPTGRFGSFQGRAWPSAELNGERVVQILCTYNYHPAKARGEWPHDELKVMVMNINLEKPAWRAMKKRFSNLNDAKDAAQIFFDQNPDWIPKVDKS